MKNGILDGVYRSLTDNPLKTPLTKQQHYWLNHLQACEASGKDIAAYAKGHGLKAKTMYAGKKVLISKGVMLQAHARFQRAYVVNTVVANKWLIQLPNGVSVSFSGTVNNMRPLHEVDFSLEQGKNRRKSAVYKSK